MAKAPLTEREIALIKGLIRHKGLNDQQVLAMFSYLDRDLNHRDIGAIRKGTITRYSRVTAATDSEVDVLLYKYGKIADLAERLGFYQTTYNAYQVQKSSGHL